MLLLFALYIVQFLCTASSACAFLNKPNDISSRRALTEPASGDPHNLNQSALFNVSSGDSFPWPIDGTNMYLSITSDLYQDPALKPSEALLTNLQGMSIVSLGHCLNIMLTYGANSQEGMLKVYRYNDPDFPNYMLYRAGHVRGKVDLTSPYRETPKIAFLALKALNDFMGHENFYRSLRSGIYGLDPVVKRGRIELTAVPTPAR